MPVFSKTAYSSPTKLIGESLCISEHGIGYSNLAFAANKGQKRPIFSFKPLKWLHLLVIHFQGTNNIKKVPNKNPFKKGNLDLAFNADEILKGQNLILVT